MAYPVDIAVIVEKLADRIDSLCKDLFPKGKAEGLEYRIGDLTGRPGRSLAIHLGKGKAGVWADFAGGRGGDALDLVAHTLHGGDKGAAIRWAATWLGLEGDSTSQREQLRRDREHLADPGPAPDHHDTQQQKTTKAMGLWLACKPGLAGTPVERYLAGRAVPLAELGRVPRSIRYHPRLWNGESGRHWGGMVAGVTLPDGTMPAIHRTFLQEHGDGRVTKAPLRDPKLSLGPIKGGFIRLWRGASGKPLAEAPAEPVVLAEGIEDGLTSALYMRELRVLVAINVRNLATLILPPQLDPVYILRQADHADRDNPDVAGAINAAVRFYSGQGRRVMLVLPPLGKDINDTAQMLRRPA